MKSNAVFNGPIASLRMSSDLGKLEVICQRSCGIDGAIAGRAIAAAAPPAAAVKNGDVSSGLVATDGRWKCRRAIVAAGIQIL